MLLGWFGHPHPHSATSGNVDRNSVTPISNNCSQVVDVDYGGINWSGLVLHHKQVGKMSTSAVKRKQPEPKTPMQLLAAQEKTILQLIKSKREVGIWSKDIKQETNIPDAVVSKCLKVLVGKKLVKEVPNFKNKAKKTYMAAEFEPTEELTGGVWCNQGDFDPDLIEPVKRLCIIEIRKMGVGTIEEIANAIRRTQVLKFECPTTKIHQLVKTLMLSGQLIEIKSTGFGEFSSIPVGVVCYKTSSKNTLPKTAALASIPCGVCPHMSICTPDGLVSPSNCVYFDKWLDF